MTCRRFVPDVVDHARGIALDPRRRDAVMKHVGSCASCAGLLQRERAISHALRRVADAQDVPSARDMQLQMLLAAFDASRARQRRVSAAVEWSLAASVLIVAGLAAGWSSTMPAGVSPEHIAATPAPPINAGEAFVVLPGASALPRFEHGQVIQMDIPSASGTVHAEVLIGQDGLARAARLVQ